MKVLILLVALSVPQKKASLSADEVLKNVERTFDGIENFVVTVEGEINMERIRVPRTTTTMYFKKPDKVHFDSESFAMIPRDGITLNPATLRQRYKAVASFDDTLGGKKVAKLQLLAKDLKARLRDLLIWVDTTNWTIAKAEASPYEGRTITFEFSYSLEAQRFWMPSRMKVSFGFFLPEIAAPKAGTPDMTKPIVEEMQRAPRIGWITLSYVNYRINTNLSDEIFLPREPR
jgi:outer membrane lipoprotein-sorting protein